MELIGYRFKNHKEDCWAYTYDLDGVRRGKGLRNYKYVDSIYAEKEKRYFWKYKKIDKEDDCYLTKDNCGLMVPDYAGGWPVPFNEKEIIEAGYNPDMFEKEEVE